MKAKKSELVERSKLDIELSRRDFSYCDVIAPVNALLPPELWLTEKDLKQIIVGQKQVNPDQAIALAVILKCSVGDIFPDLERGAL